MSDNWSVIKEEVHAYRSYVNKLHGRAAEKAEYCYLLTRQEIERLLSLKGNGDLLGGLRIYLGAKVIDGHLVPNVHVVACEKDGEQYNDFNVPTNMPHVAMAVEPGVTPLAFAAAAPAGDDGKGNTGGLFPCPNFCSGKNILNS